MTGCSRTNSSPSNNVTVCNIIQVSMNDQYFAVKLLRSVKHSTYVVGLSKGTIKNIVREMSGNFEPTQMWQPGQCCMNLNYACLRNPGQLVAMATVPDYRTAFVIYCTAYSNTLCFKVEKLSQRLTVLTM